MEHQAGSKLTEQRRVEVTRALEHSAGRWSISFILWAKCGCYYDRHSFIMNQLTEPTETEILTAIEHYEDYD